MQNMKNLLSHIEIDKKSLTFGDIETELKNLLQ